MLTPFGIALRKLRLDHGLRLLDLARCLGQSSAFVSAVETGRKPIPPRYVEQVAGALKLSAEETSELQKAADRSRAEVRVDNVSAPNRELVAAFARKVDEMPTEFLDQIRQRVFKSSNGEAPFKRTRKGLLVSPTRTSALRSASEQVRSALVPSDQIEFPVMDVVEFRLTAFFPDFYLDVCGRDVLGDDEGRVVAGKQCIMLRQDVYEAAWDGQGRARFTVAHELGHFLMHRELTMARVREDHHPIYRDAEWQADEFAGGLLMSARHLRSFANADDAARKCGMSVEAARVMLSKYRKEGAM
jgi:transcriptional regulator with XRE-family HTH domain